MITIVRTVPGPACLEEEKKKSKGDYGCGDTYSRLKDDFHGKCYICGYHLATDWETEHFKPQKQYPKLRCEWLNLRYSCGNCNKNKNYYKLDILDCQEPTHNVLEAFISRYEPKTGDRLAERAVFEPIDTSLLTQNTIGLLDRVFNGADTDNSKDRSGNLRTHLQSEIDMFGEYVDRYITALLDDSAIDLGEAAENLKPHLHFKSPFYAFKYWRVKERGALVYLTDMLVSHPE